jgi:hypothetical protein
MGRLVRAHYVELRPLGRALLLGFLLAYCSLIPFLCSGVTGGFLNGLAISDQG